MAEDLKLNQKRFTQLNEKVSETEYDILYPETHAEVVHTTTERQFVSESEKELWNVSLRFAGSWNANTVYNVNEIVEYQEKYYLMVNVDDSLTVQGNNFRPKEDSSTTVVSNSVIWRNINYEAYIANRADTVRVDNKATPSTYRVVFTGSDQYAQLYSNEAELKFKIENQVIDGETQAVGTLIVDRVQGTVTHAEKADEADHAKEADHATNADHATEADHATNADHALDADHADNADVADKYVEYTYDSTGKHTGTSGQTPYISDEFHEIDKRFEDLASGELNIKVKPLEIKFDGVKKVEFDGSIARSVDIKQTYEPKDLVDFLDGQNKIKEKWLPSSIVGAMNFIGTFDASTGNIETDLRDFLYNEDGTVVTDTNGQPVRRNFKVGDYFIVVTAGSYDPAGNYQRNPEIDGQGDDQDLPFYQVGDWTVYIYKDGTAASTHQEEWIKIDNTDSVRTVNDQIGDVKTFKGTYVEGGKQYYQGDIVRCGVSLYLATKNFVSDTAENDINSGNLYIFGKVYQGSSPITVNNITDVISHDKTTVTTNEYETITLNNKEATIDVTLLGYDDWGHINATGVQKYKLGDFFQDSTRPIQVKGAELLKGEGEERKYPVNYTADETWISVVGTKGADNAEIKFSHKTLASAPTVKPDPASDTTLYFGSSFKIPTITFDKAGHYSSQGSVTFTLSEEAIQHRHFDVTKVGNALTILAHEYADDLEAGRFYNTSAPKMSNTTADPNYLLGFKGSIEAYSFIQRGNEVLDETITVSSGYDYYGEVNPDYDPNDPSKGPARFEKEIIGTYNKTTNTITLGESGLFSGNEPRTYSAVAFNKQGIAVAGGYVLQFGGDTAATNVPSTALVVGGLFFRRRSSLVSSSLTPTASLEEALV